MSSEPPGAAPAPPVLPRCPQHESGYDPAPVDALLTAVARRLAAGPAAPGPDLPGRDGAGACAPGDGAPGNGASDDGASDDGAPGDGAPGDGAPDPGALRSAPDAAAGAAPGPGERPVITSAAVRAAVFDAVPGGYRTGPVDEALARAEEELAALERTECVRAHGAAAWRARTGQLAAVLRGRLGRPRTQRFRRPARVRTRGYSAAHVDVLCERVAERLATGAGPDAAAVREAVFPPAHGERAYEEQQVDAFLDRVVEYLLGVR
ncbi:DivIVA domain-containing protein [Kocuria flava]|uniref:DivIVA domain-containing protein n=1 Tax=Kocuria flava TaxID=446860 RepID=UPI002F937DC4